MERLLRIVAVAVVAGAMVSVPAAAAKSGEMVAVSAASTGSGVHVRLSVLPLPASALGSAASSLALQRDSGVISNQSDFRSTSPVYPNRSGGNYLGSMGGRVSGYSLDYGVGASGAVGVTEVWTSVDKYKTRADAKKALNTSSQEESSSTDLHGALTLNTTTGAAFAPGHGFAILVSYSAANIAPLFGLDEQFTVGRFEADVTVWASSAGAAKSLAPRLATKLHARIKRALAGRLHAKPVELPSPGPPDGPSLAPLLLQTTDLTGQASVITSGYLSPNPYPYSFYQVGLHPAGQFQTIYQYIYWYPTLNQANFDSDFVASVRGPGSLDLSSLGDGAWGIIVHPTNSRPTNLAHLEFSSGQIREDVLAINNRVGPPIRPSQAENLAQIVANHINAVGYGS